MTRPASRGEARDGRALPEVGAAREGGALEREGEELVADAAFVGEKTPAERRDR